MLNCKYLISLMKLVKRLKRCGTPCTPVVWQDSACLDGGASLHIEQSCMHLTCLCWTRCACPLLVQKRDTKKVSALTQISSLRSCSMMMMVSLSSLVCLLQCRASSLGGAGPLDPVWCQGHLPVSAAPLLGLMQQGKISSVPLKNAAWQFGYEDRVQRVCILGISSCQSPHKVVAVKLDNQVWLPTKSFQRFCQFTALPTTVTVYTSSLGRATPALLYLQMRSAAMMTKARPSWAVRTLMRIWPLSLFTDVSHKSVPWQCLIASWWSVIKQKRQRIIK